MSSDRMLMLFLLVASFGAIAGAMPLKDFAKEYGMISRLLKSPLTHDDVTKVKGLITALEAKADTAEEKHWISFLHLDLEKVVDKKQESATAISTTTNSALSDGVDTPVLNNNSWYAQVTYKASTVCFPIHHDPTHPSHKCLNSLLNEYHACYASNLSNFC